VYFRQGNKGGSVSDWLSDDFGVSVSSAADLVEPPKNFLIGTGALAAVSLISLVFNSWVGYVFAVLASVVGSVVIFLDLKRRANPNYVTLGWFSPTLKILRFGVVLIALIHIVRLAIESAR